MKEIIINLKIISLRILLLFSKKGEFNFKKIIVVAPHPDDEVLGLGGLLAKCRNRIEKITVIFLTDGEKSLPDLNPDLIKKQRIASSEIVLEELNFLVSNTVRLHLKDGHFPEKEDTGYIKTINLISDIILKEKPDAIFSPHPFETWPVDHVKAFEITKEALEISGWRCDLYGYWVWLWLEIPFNKINAIKWNRIKKISIKNEIAIKRKLLSIYLNAKTDSGRAWCGVLPGNLIRVNTNTYEIVEKF